MRAIRKFLSEDTIINIGLYGSIFTWGLLIALSFIIYTSLSEIENSIPIEGNIESISRSKLTIEGYRKPITLVCNCKFLNHQPDKYKHAVVLVTPIENHYKATSLILDGELIFDEKSNLKVLAVVWIIVALLTFFLTSILRSALKRESSIPDENYDLDRLFHEVKSKTEFWKKPGVRLLKSDDHSISKFGGSPFVEKETFKWPENHGKAMTFLAQIDLEETAKEVQYDWLPPKGILLFFYDTIEKSWGFDPKHRHCWKVIYCSQPNVFADIPINLNKKHQLNESFIKATRVEIFPEFDDIDFDALDFSDEEVDVYIEISSESEEIPLHQFGGFSSPVQNGMMNLQAQLVSNGIYLGGGEVSESEEVAKLESGADDWKLLFQFDSDKELGAMWGDAGRIYFWVQAEKAKKGEFDNCWLFLQC